MNWNLLDWHFNTKPITHTHVTKLKLKNVCVRVKTKIRNIPAWQNWKMNMSTLKTISWIFVWILAISIIHWMSFQLLAISCHPQTWYGMVTNLFTLGSPMCTTLNKIQMSLSDTYTNLWISVGLTFSTWIISQNKKDK